jgi:hypothetical protein
MEVFLLEPHDPPDLSPSPTSGTRNTDLCTDKPNVAKHSILHTLHGVRNYFSLYIRKHSPHWRIFRIKLYSLVRHRTYIYFFCYKGVISLLYDRPFFHKFEIRIWISCKVKLTPFDNFLYRYPNIKSDRI